ncbi:glycoside hydrolase family 88 protein [Serendipita vermifera MAFF 305830]|uniref:Glycoside hydrolase family 88 protein n=1 Tax=Serendipita vermifera MAFF 305830 TaxID=933852 RepID=A0A0C2WVR4_SERVB|nr:glycoside hydrolase family 88 protein [Serendipita vermifera MAFF 305830]
MRPVGYQQHNATVPHPFDYPLDPKLLQATKPDHFRFISHSFFTGFQIGKHQRGIMKDMMHLLRLVLFVVAFVSTPTSASLESRSSQQKHHDIFARHSSHQHHRRAPAVSARINSPLIYSKYDTSSATYRTNSYPHLTSASGSWSWVGNDWWTSGFFPGTLYLLNERSKKCPGKTNVDWLARARKWSEGLVPLESSNSVGHDTGFLAYPFLSELKVNPNNATAKAGVKAFAAQLANRFDSTVGCTRSWDSSYPDFLVIIDNMMNLELLYEAAKLFTGLDKYYDIAASHASTTAVHHLRPDASSYHIVDYDQRDGSIIYQHTGQGYADWSTWSRGQAWGTYGFAMMYNHTSYAGYLDVARRMGQKWLSRLAEDSSGVPKWDFDAPEPAPKDTSAATIASVAFLQLYYAESSRGNSTGATYWRDNAVKVLSATADQYFQTSTSWNALLSNGTSNKPSNVYNTGLVYGDYYFVKAGNMMLDLGLIGC